MPLPPRAVPGSDRPLAAQSETPADVPASAPTHPPEPPDLPDLPDLPDRMYAYEPIDRFARLIRAARPAIAVYGATAFLHLTVLTMMDRAASGPGIRSRLLAWDAGWFTDIAAHGYADRLTFTPQGELTSSNLAFPPLYPALIRAVHAVTGLDFGSAAVVSAHLSLLAALIAVHQLLTRLYGQRTATIATCLLAGAQPMAIVYFMGYSESLFLALAATSLLALHRRAWLTAGFFALLAGLTRPTAVAVASAVIVAAVTHLIQVRHFTWRPIAAVLLGSSGTFLYLWWVGQRLGRPDAWFRIQEAGWGTHWDFGRAFLGFLGDTLVRGDGWVAVSTAVLVLVIVAISAAAVMAGPRTWPPLVAYGVTVVVLALGQSNYYHAKLRMLIPALLFLVPPARALAEARPRTAGAVLVGTCLFGCWYGASILTTWPYAI